MTIKWDKRNFIIQNNSSKTVNKNAPVTNWLIDRLAFSLILLAPPLSLCLSLSLSLSNDIFLSTKRRGCGGSSYQRAGPGGGGVWALPLRQIVTHVHYRFIAESHGESLKTVDIWRIYLFLTHSKHAQFFMPPCSVLNISASPLTWTLTLTKLYSFYLPNIGDI